MIRNIEVAELEKYVLERAKQYGIAEPEKYAAKSIGQLSDLEKQEIIKDFWVFDSKGDILAGAWIWEGKYLQNILFRENHIEDVIRFITEKYSPVRFYLNSVPNKFHPAMIEILNTLNFEEHTLYDLRKELFGTICNSGLGLGNIENYTEEQAEGIYNFHKDSLDFSYEIMKHSGGEISRTLSFLDESTKTIVLVTSVNLSVNENIYTIRSIKSEVYPLSDLIKFIETQIYSLHPEGIIHLHADEKEFAVLKEMGYEITSQQAYFDFHAQGSHP